MRYTQRGKYDSRKPVTVRTYCAGCDQYKYCQAVRGAMLCTGIDGCATLSAKR